MLYLTSFSLSWMAKDETKYCLYCSALPAKQAISVPILLQLISNSHMKWKWKWKTVS